MAEREGKADVLASVEAELTKMKKREEKAVDKEKAVYARMLS
eukprot:SAG11_NODE_5805_length_1460_cov_1.194710_3_plen_42_part_00